MVVSVPLALTVGFAGSVLVAILVLICLGIRTCGNLRRLSQIASTRRFRPKSLWLLDLADFGGHADRRNSFIDRHLHQSEEIRAQKHFKAQKLVQVGIMRA